MWAGRNKKTQERQHLSVLRVNKRLYVTAASAGSGNVISPVFASLRDRLEPEERFKFYLEMLFGFINNADPGKAC